MLEFDSRHGSFFGGFGVKDGKLIKIKTAGALPPHPHKLFEKSLTRRPKEKTYKECAMRIPGIYKVGSFGLQ